MDPINKIQQASETAPQASETAPQASETVPQASETADQITDNIQRQVKRLVLATSLEIDKFDDVESLCDLGADIGVADILFVLRCDPKFFGREREERTLTLQEGIKKDLLKNKDLSGVDLREADLRRADFREADLRRADLRGADLRGADLRGADLRGADLRGADLRGVKLMQSKLWGADFRGANLPDGCMISENEDFYGPGGGLMARVKNR